MLRRCYCHQKALVAAAVAEEEVALHAAHYLDFDASELGGPTYVCLAAREMACCDCNHGQHVKSGPVLAGRQGHAKHEVVVTELTPVYLVVGYQLAQDTNEIVACWSCSNHSVCPTMIA
jgi:hypothetical protein